MTTKTQKPKISFLFGSGISLELGLPSTKDITDIILSGKQANINRSVYKGDTKAFYLCSKGDKRYQPKDEKSQQLVQLIVSFLNTCAGYFSNPNYEQVYEVVYQIYYVLSEKTKNPPISNFIDKIKPSFDQKISLYNQARTYPESVGGLQELCYKSLYYIESIVEQLINEKCQDLSSQNLGYLDWLGNVIENCEVQQIATLNHDLVLETFLENRKVEYSTGFISSQGEGSPTYQFNWSTSELPLLKLHGSIGWYTFQKVGQLSIKYRDLRSVDHWNGMIKENGKTDTSESAQEWYSMKIMGTESKPKKYMQSIYNDLFHHFIDYLSQSDVLLIAGYSFGDQAVNDYIYEQMLLNKQLKVVVVHHDKNSIIQKSKILQNADVKFIDKAICKNKCPLTTKFLIWSEVESILKCYFTNL